jgi:nitroimidazol reductase NimA-like FMN-containing flavoprotein (pyridoxamine 5'-phosphate oxidase superfamily)
MIGLEVKDEPYGIPIGFGYFDKHKPHILSNMYGKKSP